MSGKKATTAVPLVVTTKNKGVFFGYAQPTTEATIRIERARMCVFWSVAMKGVLGLAVIGPDKECRIGPAVPGITLQDVTSVMECTPEAAQKWEAQPWSN